MAKDRLGNELKQGDLVDVVLRSAANPAQTINMTGVVQEITGGGLMLRGAKTHGSVSVALGVKIEFDPANPSVIEILKLQQPAEKKKVLAN